jgi:Bacterial PH domain
MQPASGRVRIRRGDLVPMLAGLCGFLALLCIGLAAVGTAVATPLRAAIGLAALPFVVLVVRLLPTGVYVDDDGVLIRNIPSSRRLAWSQIERFAIGKRRGFGDFPCGEVVLTNGEHVTIGALNPSAAGGPAEIVPLIDDLNARLARATGRTSTPAIQDL